MKGEKMAPRKANSVNKENVEQVATVVPTDRPIVPKDIERTAGIIDLKPIQLNAPIDVSIVAEAIPSLKYRMY